jgi:hypothetical protein
MWRYGINPVKSFAVLNTLNATLKISKTPKCVSLNLKEQNP